MCQPNELKQEIRKKTWGAQGGPSKNLGGHGPPRPPLRIATDPKAFGTSASDQRIYPPFPLLNDLNTVQIWLPEKNAQVHQKDNYL